jgi:phospholipid/cholesterol/gamma-HCH transport system permease protein
MDEPTSFAMRLRPYVERVGQRSVQFVEEAGYMSSLLWQSLLWLIAGYRREQPVRLAGIFREAMHMGIQAIPIISILCFSVGVMLAIQGIDALKAFGAQAQVVNGIALSVTREFAPLIVGILVAGRSGSAIAARIGTMLEAQEIDALRVIGIDPIRYLAAPILVAMTLMLPCLTVLGDVMGIFGGAVFTGIKLQLPLEIYAQRTFDFLDTFDVMQGLIKSVVFGMLIALVGLSNGFQVSGGAEGVGRATTRAVVMAISLIVIADMIFTYFMNR